MAEAFVKTFKRHYAYLNDLPDAATVMAKLPEWIEDYNLRHPHKGLKMNSPWEYRAELASNESGVVRFNNAFLPKALLYLSRYLVLGWGLMAMPST